MMVITGFEPFGNFKENPTEELAKYMGSLGYESIIVPVTFHGAREAAERIISMEPEAVVSLGLAFGRNQISFEMVGINIMDSRQADNQGYRPRMERIYQDGPFSYQSTLPIVEIMEEMKREGIPSYISYHAGTYVCNTLLYSLLYNADKNGVNIPIGFVHFPATEKMAMERNVPYVEFKTMKKAVKIIADVTSRLSSP